MIFDFFSSTDYIEGPVIPLDFTEEEMKEAKDFAYASVKANFNGVESKEFRLQLPQAFRRVILINLINSFNQAVKSIKKRKS